MSRPTFEPSPPDAVEYHAEGDRWTLVFVRVLRHGPEKVWDALTDPDQVAQWAPYTADRDLGNGWRRDADDDRWRHQAAARRVGHPRRAPVAA